jgi:sugar (pentulose or hexulose) kinase
MCHLSTPASEALARPAVALQKGALMNPSKDLVIGVDSSTTACKAIAWDRDGHAIAAARQTYEMTSPQPNWGEQLAEDWWHALTHVLREVTAQIGAERVAALCITNQRETFVPVDAGGSPLRSAILWLDSRCRAQLDELDRRYGSEVIHELTGKGPATTQSLAKLMWLQQHEPTVVERAYKFVEPHAYLVHHLTGQWMTSLACADPMGLVDMRRGMWAVDLLSELGLDPDQFVGIVPPGSVIGTLTDSAAQETGLLAETLVVAGAGDGQCAGLGGNITAPGRAYLNLGTAVVSGTYTADYVVDRAFRTLCAPIAGAFVPEHVLAAGTFIVSWFAAHFAPDVSGLGLEVSPEEVMELAARKLPPGSLGLMVVPYWKGVLSPYWDPAATGITVGWTGAHGQAHFYRAILEGIAYEHRLAMDGISRATGEPIDEFILMGGGSRSDLWCQIVADVNGKPVARASSAGATSLGAGILAATAAGWYPDARDAAAAMTSTEETFTPDAATHAIYDRLYHEVYRGLFPAIQPYVDRLTALTDEQNPDV